MVRGGEKGTEINTKCCPQIDSQHDAKLDGTTRKKSKLKSATGNPAFV